jgi:uncharacterized protein YeaO (DUF488 family)
MVLETVQGISIKYQGYSNLMSIRIKRIYENAEALDGYRVLVDRIWPRNIKKTRIHINAWAKELAPSTVLRAWFRHDPDKWQGFKERYLNELRLQSAEIRQEIEKISFLLRRSTVTFVYGARDEQYNNAIALKEFFDNKLLRSK